MFLSRNYDFFILDYYNYYKQMHLKYLRREPWRKLAI